LDSAYIEPNIQSLPDDIKGIKLVNYNEAMTTADVHVLLVGNEEFLTTDKPKNNLIDVTGHWSKRAKLD